MEDSALCKVFTDQVESVKELMTEKFERVFDRQDGMTKRIDAQREEMKELDLRVDKIEQSIVELQTEKDTSTRNTRWLVIGIGIILAALEVYIVFKK